MASGHFSILRPAIEPLSYRRLSFADPSQGYVFMSGVVLGLVLSRRLSQSGYTAIIKYCRGRVLLIYKYHLATLAFAILTAVMVPNLNFGNVTGNAPFWNFVGGSLLLHQPKYIDILPMYLVLVAVSPIVLKAFFNGQVILVLGGSFCLWLLAPIGPTRLGFEAFGKLAEHSEITGSNRFRFDVFAWQFIYLAGLFVGFLVAKNSFPFDWFNTRAARDMVIVSVAVFLLC